MFTGIIEAIGRVVGVENQDRARRITVEATTIVGSLHLGDGIAVSGRYTPRTLIGALA